MNKGISRGSGEQGQTVSQISQNVTAINPLSVQTASSSVEVADTACQVNELAIQLQSLMGLLKMSL